MHDAAQLPDTLQAALAPDMAGQEISALEEAVFAEEPRKLFVNLCTPQPVVFRAC
jgi:hypothetical protein